MVRERKMSKVDAIKALSSQNKQLSMTIEHLHQQLHAIRGEMDSLRAEKHKIAEEIRRTKSNYEPLKNRGAVLSINKEQIEHRVTEIIFKFIKNKGDDVFSRYFRENYFPQTRIDRVIHDSVREIIHSKWFLISLSKELKILIDKDLAEV